MNYHTDALATMTMKWMAVKYGNDPNDPRLVSDIDAADQWWKPVLIAARDVMRDQHDTVVHRVGRPEFRHGLTQ